MCKCHTILFKGLQHLQILASVRVWDQSPVHSEGRLYVNVHHALNLFKASIFFWIKH